MHAPPLQTRKPAEAHAGSVAGILCQRLHAVTSGQSMAALRVLLTVPCSFIDPGGCAKHNKENVSGQPPCEVSKQCWFSYGISSQPAQFHGGR